MLAAHHIEFMLCMTVPFRTKLFQRQRRRMKNNHYRNVTECESRGAGALSPFHVLGKVDSRKRPNLLIVRSSNDQVSRPAVTMFFDKKLEPVGENLLIRFDPCERIPAITPNPDIATENRSFWRGTNGLKSIAEPVAMRATIGIDEGNDIACRGPNS